MSSSDRRTFVLGLLAAAPLAGCGFTPVYAPGGAGTVLRDQILVDAPDTRLEFTFVSRLEERLGRGAAGRYGLGYDIAIEERGIAVTGSNDITRINLTGTITYRVTETATGDQIHVGEVRTFSAYSTTGSTISTAAAARDAEDRLMVALADRIVSDLLASAGRWT